MDQIVAVELIRPLTFPVDRMFGYEPTGNGTNILPEWDGTWYFLQDTKKPILHW
jgi:hypothetical protein